MAEACLEVASLREERAAADERARLESYKATLRTQITKLREGGGSIAPDPVAELFAWLSRGQLSVRDIGFGFLGLCIPDRDRVGVWAGRYRCIRGSNAKKS